MNSADSYADSQNWYFSLHGFEYYEYVLAVTFYRAAWVYAQLAIPLDAEQCNAAVDFLPGQQFQQPVYVTLSYASLNFQGDPEDLDVYWYDEDTDTWILVSDSDLDEQAQTISVYVDHFTRFGWALGGDEGNQE